MVINRKTLLEHLEKARPALASKPMIIQSDCFVFMDGRVFTYNDEISISRQVPEINFEGAVPANEFYGYLSKLKKDEVTIEVEGSILKISSGRSSAQITFDPSIHLPLDDVLDEKKWKAIPEGLLEGMHLSSFCAGDDTRNPLLCCIHVAKDRVEACDNTRFLIHEMETELPVDPFLIPLSSLRQFKAYNLKHIARTGTGWVHFRDEDKATILSCRVFSDKFMDLSMINLQEETARDIKWPTTLVEALERVQSVTTPEKGELPMVQIAVGENKWVITGKGDKGTATEVCNVRYTDAPFTFNTAIDFLKEAAPLVTSSRISGKLIEARGDKWRHVLALLEDE